MAAQVIHKLRQISASKTCSIYTVIYKKNDAGIYQTQHVQAADFLTQAVNTQLSNTAQLIEQDQCLDLMIDYARHYRKGHLGVYKVSSLNNRLAFMESIIQKTALSPSVEELSPDTVVFDTGNY